MKCFYHHDLDAVAICKSCGKGLCPECCSEVTGEFTNSISCKNKCEKQVELLQRIIENNRKVLFVTKRQVKISAYVGIFMGILFIPLSLTFLPNIYVTVIFSLIGILFILFGVLKLVKKSQYPELIEEK